MREITKFYIDGKWVEAADPVLLDVINPATEQVAGHVAIGNAQDVDIAVTAARRAFADWSRTTVAERVDALNAIIAEYQKRMGDLAAAVTEEMGAPDALAAGAQVPIGLAHLMTAAAQLPGFSFAEDRGTSRVVKEPIGVCGFITPWNWPLNQLTCKIAPALATGCTIVVKPSEVAPFSAAILAEIIDTAGLPAGVFNLVNGDGPGVGAALSSHPDIDMVSITGSTRAGIEVAKAAAPTVKRVAQELGGKSPNVILDDASLAKNVAGGVLSVMTNSGQSCNAPTRMLVPAARMDEAIEAAQSVADKLTVGAPDSGARLGPVVSQAQFDKIQTLIQSGIDAGATVAFGGTGRPDGLSEGYYVRPTVFANVDNNMEVARTEIFGPVLVIIGYDDVDDAVAIANDTEYGLAGYVSGDDTDAVRSVASRIRAGQIFINGAGPDPSTPFGGYKQSGNGREWSDYAFDDFLEVKSLLGYTV
ncbi:aldehyde dehydrogenase family protein [Gordonia sp. (in: high G+C Gram-positive bacteria)]|jgi:aldehyde dehydrogenase (NAD+)|uniref:aldehyde dehydrogenase family protein n=1 Tax=Gordonia sp. (in: high G+C Gram-positive bacteria) TaxID=84139 RepID=UPI001DCDED6C|nr:aldehyde dehydrogenase family protein [Gordonia sp. (in: high G+C Gram-positive bacteria)]MCB1294609.1 aldehyde dehydrogenase family protein [Gordonia sp. (in: high G+C Gram-positive bacteria)]HMS76551.1 aldehyde dehydrogenase family protein [Gordonia sp. (in: high G+C Gram-positive bacteria)]HQV17991.1 aldehyde dehydrogenase family protein [Gordonia sp. (in: high G+C Gram-positive bacteria)]